MIEKLPTHIPGLDHITDGGLPRSRTTLVSGTAGTAKTILAAQFLAASIVEEGEPGVFVTFEETPDDIRKNMRGFGWDIAAWEKQGLWTFVDVSPDPTLVTFIEGDFDLSGLFTRIEAAVTRAKASRLAMDSLGAVFTHLTDAVRVRREMLKIAFVLKKLGVTSILTAERLDEHGSVARFGVEEFVADNVLVLRNTLEEEKRRRTVEILKYRGASHRKGEFPFAVVPDTGVLIIPVSDVELKQESSEVRISSGNGKLDTMCGGGLFRDSVVLVSGATGTGKTLMATEFIAAGVQEGERCLLFAFEESRQQLFRNSKSWGLDFAAMEQEGRLRVVCVYPETAGLEDHLITIRNAITEFSPNRVAIDSLSALERVGNARGFREFVIGLTSFIKHHEVAGLFTSTTPNLLGGGSITDAHISSITDSIILLRYVELTGQMLRGLTVLKMRGSAHDKTIRAFTIDDDGMRIGDPFRDVSGIISGKALEGRSASLPGDIDTLLE